MTVHVCCRCGESFVAEYSFIIDPETKETRLAADDDDWLCPLCEAEFEEKLNRD